MTQAEGPNETNSLDNTLLQLVEEHRQAVEAGRMDDAERAAWNLLAMMAEHAATHPDTEMLLLREATCQEAAGDWPGAEATYRKLLERAIASGEAASQYRSHAALSGLYQLLGNDNEAVQEARSATAAARRADLAILLAMALDQQATCALRLQLVAEAVAAVEEALRGMTDEKVYDLTRARCLIVRAECGLKSGKDAAAEGDLNAAWQLLETQSAMQLAAGVHATLARYWSVKARLQGEQSDWNGAVLAWDKAVACRRHVAELPQGVGPYTHNALAETLAAYGHARATAGDRQVAEELLAESSAIRRSMGLP